MRPSRRRGTTWEVIMYESGTQRQIHRLHFQDSDKLVEMASRGRALKDLADKQALEHGISTGNGALKLYLTTGQYEQLKRIRP
jgi:hypothetical protein